MAQNDGHMVLTLTLASIAEGLNDAYKVAYEMHADFASANDPLTDKMFGIAAGIDSSLTLFMEMAGKAITDYETLESFVADARQREGGLGDDNLPVGMYL